MTDRQSDRAAIWQVDGGVLVVDMSHAPVNALSYGLIAALDEAFEVLARDEIRALVIASVLPKFFAAGADIKEMAAASQEEFEAYGRAFRSMVARISSSGKPSIAAVEGRALGGGAELSLACSLRVWGERAQLSLPEARIGLIPSAGATQRLPRFVGRGRALDLLLTGREVAATEAGAIGLADRVVEAGGARAAAIALAKDLSGLSQSVTRGLLRLVDVAQDSEIAAGLAEEVACVNDLFTGADAHEGLQAFLEKRSPRFD